MGERKRTVIIDVLKIIACLFVIRIHMNGSYLPVVLLAVPLFIFIVSYNYTQSSFRHGGLTLRQWFSLNNLSGKFLRLYIPYLVFAICQCILMFALSAGYNVFNVIASLFFGGYGPGNYYLLLMFQIILIYPFLLWANRKKPRLTLILCFVFYICYHIIMRFVFPDDPGDVTTVGGAINKWGVFRWIFLIDCGIYFCMNKDKIKWWQLVILAFLDIIPFIMEKIGLPALYIRGIPFNFLVIAIAGLSIKYLGSMSFGKLNAAAAFCGNATWHIFLFQQLYFWLIGLLGWQFGYTYISFPICFAGGLIFFTVHMLIGKILKPVVKGSTA